MISNYLKIAWRSIVKNKIYTSISLVGLALAFGCSILLFLTSFYEFTFESIHENRNNIFLVYMKANSPESPQYGNSMPSPLRGTLIQEFPDEIKLASRIFDSGFQLKYKDKTLDQSAVFVDEDYIKMYSFRFLKGSKETALKDLNGAVLREDIAENIFGNEDPMGKTILVDINGNFIPFEVTGVVEKLASNTSIENDIMIRYEMNPTYESGKDKWNHSNSILYLQLNDHVSSENFEKSLKPFVEKYYKDGIQQLVKDGANPDERGELISLRLLPFTKVHFDKTIGNGKTTSIVYPYTLLIISIFLLIIASINFINLNIARSMFRAKEVGMRKVFGAYKLQIFKQFWGEAIIVCFSALILGLLFYRFSIKPFNTLFSSDIHFNDIFNPFIALAFLAIFIFITFVAGVYPAWFISKMNSIDVLKGKVSSGLQSNILRNGLIIIQFTFSILLICCTIIIWNQLIFLRNAPIGYNQENLVSIPIGTEMSSKRFIKLFKDKLANEQNIVQISAADNNLGLGKDGSTSKSQYGFIHDGKSVQTNALFVDFDYIKTLGFNLLQGRDFSQNFTTDSTEACIINESMAQVLGGKDLIGKRIGLGEKGNVIIGIVKDYHFESMKNKIEPMTLMIKGFDYRYLFVKINHQNVHNTMAILEKTYKEILPNSTFEGSFLDENRDNQYKNEKRFLQIFEIAALIAIIISCMGLFAIALMIINKRTKEIGIRKVLGSSISSIVFLLSKDFLFLVLVALVIASPISYFLMNIWLEDYAYRENIQWWIFVFAGGMAIFIAFFTISFHAINAAIRNPIQSLKSE